MKINFFGSLAIALFAAVNISSSIAADNSPRIKDLNDHPNRFDEQQVTVEGKVDRVTGVNTYDLAQSGSKILVIMMRKPGPVPRQQAGVASFPVIQQKETAQVTGTLEKLNLFHNEETGRVFDGTMPILMVHPATVSVVHSKGY